MLVGDEVAGAGPAPVLPPLHLQAAALQLLTSILAFNLEVHSKVMAAPRLVPKLVRLCR